MFWFQVKLLGDGRAPHQEPGSIGYDMFAREAGEIQPGKRSRPIPLGFCGAFTQGWAGLLLDRSSMGNKGITRFAGVIDPNYRDEWGAILYNSTDTVFSYVAGDKIIQCVFTAAGTGQPEVVAELPPSNRTGGWGSTDMSLRELLDYIGYKDISVADIQKTGIEREVTEWARKRRKAMLEGRTDLPDLLAYIYGAGEIEKPVQ